MGLFTRDIFNELQFNGQEVGDSNDNDLGTQDYTADPGPADTSTADNPADAPEDYIVPDQGEEQTPEEADQNPPDQGTEVNPNENNEPKTTDYTDDGGATEGNPEGGEAPPEGESGEDYGNDDYGLDNDYDDGGSDQSDDEIKQLEDELFSKFNDQQIAIMTRDLKKDYLNLYDKLDEIIERINDTSKEEDIIKIIEFVSNKMIDMREMISDYLQNTFNTKSFIENQINYKRFLTVLNQLNTLLGKIYPQKN